MEVSISGEASRIVFHIRDHALLVATRQTSIAFEIDIIIEREACVRQLGNLTPEVRRALIQHFVRAGWAELVV